VTHKSALRLFVTILTLAVLVGALLLVLHPAETPYLDLLRRGDEHAAAAERTAAAAAYWEAARLRPGDLAPRLRLARLYLDWGRADEALAALDTVERLGVESEHGLDVDPDAAHAASAVERLRIAAHTARADWPAVAEHARRLLDLAPADGSARHALAGAYLELGDWVTARAEYEALLQADDADALAHERLGALLLDDHPVAAVQHLSAARTNLADRLLGVMRPIADDGAQGVEETAGSGFLLGQVLAQEGEWALATRQFERVLFHDPEHADAHAYLGHAFDQMGRSDDARSHLLRAVELAPESVVARTFLGLHYDRLGAFSAARAQYEAAYDLDPDNPAVCVEIGETWAAEGRYPAAEVWLRTAVSLRPGDPVLWEVLTRFYVDHNITTEGRALEAAQMLVELAPGAARAYDLRGWAAFQAGDYVVAEENLAQAVSLDPALATAYYHKGLLRMAQGVPQKAREAFTRALDLDTTGDLGPLVERAMRALPSSSS